MIEREPIVFLKIFLINVPFSAFHIFTIEFEEETKIFSVGEKSNPIGLYSSFLSSGFKEKSLLAIFVSHISHEPLLKL